MKITSLIIFTTAFDEYAIQAFKVNSLDYLLKPIEIKDLESAFNKYDEYSAKFIQTRNQSINYDEIISVIKNAKPEFRKRFLIKSNESYVHIPVHEIAFFYSVNKITFAVTFQNREFVLDYTLESLKEQLNPENFFKINRQFIINIDSIEKIHTYFQGKLVIDTKPRHSEKIIIGKDKAAEFKRWMDR